MNDLEGIEIQTIGSVKAGDTVMVALRDGVPTAIGVIGEGDEKNAAIEAANQASEEAKAVANATGQHFFADGNGVHVTEAENNATTEHNILINSLGILLRKALAPLVSITESAIAFYDGLGDKTENIVAQFGGDGAFIGKKGATKVYATIEAGAFKIMRGASTAVGHFGYKNVTEESDDGYESFDTPYLAIGGDIECDGFKAGSYHYQASSGKACTLYRRRSDVNARYGTTAPSSVKYISSNHVRDSNNTNVFSDQVYMNTSGQLVTTYGLRRYSNNGTDSVINSMSLRVNNDGSRSVVLSESAVWCSELNHSITLNYPASNATFGTSYAKVAFRAAANENDPDSILSVSANGVKCGKAGLYEVSGAIRYSGVTAGDTINARVYVNSSGSSPIVQQVSRGTIGTIQIAPYTISMGKDSVIYVYASNGTAARGSILGSNGTYLTVKFIG